MRFKTIELWRNNLARESEEQPFLYPACFIEFMPSNYMELGMGVQSYDMTVRLHICFESYKDEDIDILRLVDATYAVVQYKSYSIFGKMKRRNEEQNFDHDNVQDYMQDYEAGKGMDYLADKRPTTPVTLTEIDVIVSPNTVPTLYASPDALDFGLVSIGVISTAQSFTASGTNLTQQITITAPGGFILNLNGGDQDDGPLTVPSGTLVYVLFSPTDDSVYDGNITIVSADAVTVNVALTAEGLASILTTFSAEGIVTNDDDYILT